MKKVSKTMLNKILVRISLLVGFIAFKVAQGSFLWWKQPRVPKHLINS